MPPLESSDDNEKIPDLVEDIDNQTIFARDDSGQDIYFRSEDSHEQVIGTPLRENPLRENSGHIFLKRKIRTSK